MKSGVAVIALILSGCGNTVPWVRPPEVSGSACTAACDAHDAQCPQIFAQFPERGAVECPAQRTTCIKACASAQEPASASATPLAVPPPAAGSARAVGSKEARLRELKHFYDEGLVTEDVYRDRQKAILAEP